jgi:DnaK suppressor protein
LSAPHLSGAQRLALRALLDARAANLRRELGEALHDPRGGDTIALPNRHADTDDDAVASLQTDLDVASMQRDARELSQVVDALARLERAEYGTCADCGEDIPWARLQAQPHATRCVRCEEAFERAADPRASPRL